jgi:hypothetical protein
MAKKADDTFIDGGPDAIALCTSLNICSAEPANFAGIAAVSLASVVIDGTDFTIANGDTSGRKVTVAQQAGMTISGTGDATHIVIDNGTDIYVTTCTTQALVSGGSVTCPAFDIEIADPV